MGFQKQIPFLDKNNRTVFIEENMIKNTLCLFCCKNRKINTDWVYVLFFKKNGTQNKSTFSYIRQLVLYKTHPRDLLDKTTVTGLGLEDFPDVDYEKNIVYLFFSAAKEALGYFLEEELVDRSAQIEKHIAELIEKQTVKECGGKNGAVFNKESILVFGVLVFSVSLLLGVFIAYKKLSRRRAG
ncbi:MAG: uncharacterized protein A8A55_1916 [Amphiamblys sp. WSBS2006]|nr:MAG: uncharacterized protein A8A55_1916 [Amphiamblys sp. WSBS2006]